jgi:glutamate synthase (NADPH/NADH) small chain
VEVDVFEARALASGLTVYGVAPYKITNEEALDEVSYLQKQFGFRIHYNHPIDKSDLSRLEADYDAIFIGIGLGNTSQLGIPGEELPGVEGAVEFVEKLRIQRDKIQVPSQVIVLGGGNTAMDAASEAARMGAESVSLVYRRSRESMGAYDFEYELARLAGVKGIFHAAPIRVIGEHRAEGVEFIRTNEQEGKMVPVGGSEFTVPAQLILKATGQGRQREFLSAIQGLELDSKGNIRCDENSFQTGNPKYYAAGDAVSGGQEVVNAVANGKKAAKAIIRNLGLG